MLGLLSRLFRISMTPSFITISKNFTPLQSFFLYLNKVICHMCVCVSWTDNEKSSSYLLIIISFIYIAATTCWVYWIAKVTLLLLTIFHLWKGGTLNTWTKRNNSNKPPKFLLFFIWFISNVCKVYFLFSIHRLKVRKILLIHAVKCIACHDPSTDTTSCTHKSYFFLYKIRSCKYFLQRRTNFSIQW